MARISGIDIPKGLWYKSPTLGNDVDGNPTSLNSQNPVIT